MGEHREGVEGSETRRPGTHGGYWDAGGYELHPSEHSEDVGRVLRVAHQSMRRPEEEGK